MSNRKYTCEVLRQIVEASFSYAEVLRRLGLKQAGGSQTNIKRLVNEYGISTDHFLGRLRNRGESHKGGSKKAAAEEILILRDPLAAPERAVRLRRAMIETGVPYRCALCGMEPLWNG